MAEFDPQELAARIDTVLNILVAGDYASAINNLEILKQELESQYSQSSDKKGTPPSPWEI
ncbi:protein YciZ/DeoL [Mangrovibacter yixingensis]|uniref:protein YciZ/DeoL n=1 Tax=Mangrovibacter yixingensis TaxID=1529639 RepID=UPI001CFAE081|nr:hypothetical protein [Mangrovibacter yixingensis]